MNSLSVALIQTNLAWENKQANVECFQKQIENLPATTQLVVLPEMFSTGFSMKPALLAETMEGHTVKWMQEIAAAKKLAIVGSLIISESGQYFNRLICMLPNGHAGIYDKRHLFSFAGEQNHYSAGNKRFIASLNGWKINMQVCYDLRFPVFARQQIKKNAEGTTIPEYDVLLYVANWPERRSYAWKILLQARAIENQCYVLAVNRVGEDGNGIAHSGDSMIIDPLGEIISTISNEESVLAFTLQKSVLEEVRSKFSFLNDADGFALL